ncbi:MAG: acetate/propionate family kinase [Acidimicrobiales bacterium]
MRVLVVNAGSSSLKLRLLGDDDRVVLAEDLGGENGVFDWARVEGIVVPVAEQVDAVGHRVVHGGDRFTGPVRLTPDVERALAELVDLAPLHQEAALAGIDAMARLLPAVPQVASFDTAFHRTMPAEASTYAVPLEWRTRFGLRRFGFHGLSHAYASRRAAQLLDRPVESLRLATCHLGSGASVTAVASGRSVDTTMGFTPLEGLVMATRSGSVDPGMLLWLIRDRGLSVEEVGEAVEHRSGLAALAGTADMAAVVEAAAGDELAELGLAVYVHHLGAAIAAMAAAMGGVDAVTFTGGVGENSAEVRARVARRLVFFGIEIDQAENRTPTLDADLSTPGSTVKAVVLRAREDLQISGEVRATLEGEPGGGAP